MSVEVRLLELRPAQRKLVRLMAEIGHGRIEGLIVHQGLPVFSPRPRIIREIRIDPSPQPRSGTPPQDYVLKAQVCRLLERLAELGDGRIEALSIADGLPLRMTVETQDAIAEKN